MSKNGNKKRAKLLCQRKKEREQQALSDNILQKNKQILCEKAEKKNIKIIDRSLLGTQEKISAVLIEMIKPILFVAKDEEDARGMVSMGVVAWNCGIIKQTLGEEKLKLALKSFQSKKYSKEKNILDKFIEIKCTLYGGYNDFITDFQISFDHDGSMNFTVLTGITDDIARTLNI